MKLTSFLQVKELQNAIYQWSLPQAL